MNRWERIWFEPGSAYAWLLVRTVVLSAVAVDLWLARGSVQRLPGRAETIWEPISVLAVVRAGPPSEGTLRTVLAVALLAAVIAALHVLPRVTGVVTAVGYGYLVLALNSLGKIDHDRQPLVLMVVIVAMAAVPRRGAEPSWRFRWPVQASRATLAVMLGAAAWSKLTVSGVDWVVTENMRNILVAQSLLFSDPVLSDLALWLSREPWTWQAAAAGALLGELALLGALVTRRAPLRALLVVAGIGTVVGITLLMGLVGFPIVVLGAVFVDGDRLVRGSVDLRARARAVLAPVLGTGALVVATVMWSTRLLPSLPALFALLLVLATVARGHERSGWLASEGRAERTEPRDRAVPGPARR